MRWNAAVALLAYPDRHQGPDGSIVYGEPERRVRFCNPYTVGADSWATAVDLGLRADAEIQLRACDYADESSCVYEGVEYDVEKVTRTGELVRLQLGRRASNG